jgi:diguanylate cyclase (GGDEF)-like protein
MVVPDALEDARFAGNPLVTGHPYIRFYAGTVVHGPGGQPLGTLCVIDHQPRDFDERQNQRLRQFADLIEQEIAHSHDLERLRSAVEFSAYRDPLTHLPNRRLLVDRLDRLIELAESQGRQVAVLLFNVAGLRLINQSFGTETGDELLRQMGERLCRHCPPGGTVARLQADELVLACSVLDAEAGQIDVVVEHVRMAKEAARSMEQQMWSTRLSARSSIVMPRLRISCLMNAICWAVNSIRRWFLDA